MPDASTGRAETGSHILARSNGSPGTCRARSFAASAATSCLTDLAWLLIIVVLHGLAARYPLIITYCGSASSSSPPLAKPLGPIFEVCHLVATASHRVNGQK